MNFFRNTISKNKANAQPTKRFNLRLTELGCKLKRPIVVTAISLLCTGYAETTKPIDKTDENTQRQIHDYKYTNTNAGAIKMYLETSEGKNGAKSGISAEKSLRKTELEKMMAVIRSVRFESDDSKISIRPNRKTSENKNLEQQQTVKKKQVESVLEGVDEGAETAEIIKYDRNDGKISQNTLQKIAKNRKKLQNWFEMGQILYNSGNLKEAAELYEIAIEQQNLELENLQWAIFQRGNCLCDSDPVTAKNAYERLINEYPKSEWNAMAAAKIKLLEWEIKERPEKLIGQETEEESAGTNGEDKK